MCYCEDCEKKFHEDDLIATDAPYGTMKKPCHIVPMYVRDAATGTGSMRDIIMPGIYEYRTTAQRTKDYMGHSKPEYGDPIDFNGVPPISTGNFGDATAAPEGAGRLHCVTFSSLL